MSAIKKKLIYIVCVCICLLWVNLMELVECQQLKQMTVNLVLIDCYVSIVRVCQRRRNHAVTGFIMNFCQSLQATGLGTQFGPESTLVTDLVTRSSKGCFANIAQKYGSVLVL
jgi:hypothetical protein